VNGASASVTFLPWLRRGIGTEITRVDGEDAPAPRAVAPVTLTLNASLTAQAPISLVGPGEIGGIDPGVIVRVYPGRDVFDAESNYFAHVELGQPDLPWRYTPARPTSGDRLRPWLCLIVLRDDETAAVSDGNADALPTVTVRSASSLPLLAQSWAWAHVQLSGAAPADAAALRRLLESEPHRAVARLLCPRRLEPRTRYTACLVPTFERGRLAGLRLPVGDGVDALMPAWAPDAVSVVLPCYHRWRFGTGIAGDFEFLVKQLRARQIPATTGSRVMDVSAPGAELPAAADPPLRLEGALTAVRQDRPPLAGLRADFVTRIITLLNRPVRLSSTPGLGPVVAPPRYGRWHAWRELVGGLLGVSRTWFDELNIDPRWRVGAGLGTQVVQAQQRQLMAGAWLQVEGVREANERLRQAQMARAAAERVFARHVAPREAEELLQLTAPVHTRVRTSPTTVHALLRGSPIADGALAPQFRRVSRRLGPVGRRQGRATGPQAPTLLGRMNAGDLTVAPPPATPSEIVTPGRAGFPRRPGWATPQVRAILRAALRYLPLIGVFLLGVAVALAVAGISLVVAVVAAVVGALAFAGARAAQRISMRLDLLDAVREGRLTPEHIARLPARPDFVARETGPGAPAPLLASATGANVDSPSARAFRSSAAAMVAQAGATPLAAVPRRPVQMTSLRDTLLRELDPSSTVTRSVRQRLRVDAPTAFQPGADPLEPPLAAPVFPQPMYAELKKLSPDWLLPGLDRVPPNTVALLVTNQRFIESFMVGLNHEMARELQWNEYPTDLRGTYFRQFWDVAGHVAPAGPPLDPESLRDIRPIHEWESSALGDNSSRQTPAGGDHLVLLLRGDLLRRYPNTMISARRACLDEDGRRVLSEALEDERAPVFGGYVEPDVSFFGFELTAAAVRGVTDRTSPEQGWFIVLQEQPSEMRFGLDDAPRGDGMPVEWANLAWPHLGPADPARPYIDLDADQPDTTAITTPPGVAWHADGGLGATGSRASDIAYITMQPPARVAWHGSDMIPPP
jgi:hypothetical protein